MSVDELLVSSEELLVDFRRVLNFIGGAYHPDDYHPDINLVNLAV